MTQRTLETPTFFAQSNHTPHMKKNHHLSWHHPRYVEIFKKIIPNISREVTQAKEVLYRLHLLFTKDTPMGVNHHIRTSALQVIHSSHPLVGHNPGESFNPRKDMRLLDQMAWINILGRNRLV